MNTYLQFLEQKKQKVKPRGFSISQDELNPILFDFQKYIVQKALEKGRYAIFAIIGLLI